MAGIQTPLSEYLSEQLLNSSREKKFHERRIQSKKHHSAKKQSRRGPSE